MASSVALAKELTKAQRSAEQLEAERAKKEALAEDPGPAIF